MVFPERTWWVAGGGGGLNRGWWCLLSVDLVRMPHMPRTAYLPRPRYTRRFGKLSCAGGLGNKPVLVPPTLRRAWLRRPRKDGGNTAVNWRRTPPQDVLGGS